MNDKKHIEDILYYFEKYHYENMILDDNEAKFIHDYIINLQSKIDELNNENFELSKRIHNTKKIVNKVKKVSDYMNGIACDDLLKALEEK